MASSNASFLSDSPRIFPIRPLNKGVQLSTHPGLIPSGGFSYLNNFFITDKGLMRRPTWHGYAEWADPFVTSNLGDAPIDMFTYRDPTTNLLNAGLLTSHSFGGPFWCWIYTTGTGTVNATGAGVTATGSLWATAASQIRVGDVIKVYDGTHSEYRLIDMITNDTTIALDEDLAYVYTNADYTIYRMMSPNDDGHVDHTTVTLSGADYVVFADGSRPPYMLNGSSFSCMDTASTYYPYCVTFYKDRLWMANLYEGADLYPQRLRWSSPLDFTSFSAGDYTDLPYTLGKIKRILPLKDLLIVYTVDGVYICRSTTSPLLPIVADLHPNSNAALVSQQAVVSWLGGHFFMSHSDVFFLDENGNMESLGSPIMKQITDNYSPGNYVIQTAVDKANDRIIFGVKVFGTVEKLLSFFYKTKSWGVEECDLRLIASAEAQETTVGLNNVTISRLYAQSDALVSGIDGTYYLSSSGTYDHYGSTNSSVSVTLTTPEYDLDAVDEEKTFLRFSLKLASPPSTTLTLAVTYSLDGGTTYVSAGNIVIAAIEREGRVDFIATGSSIIFNVTSSSAVYPYEIIEYSFKAQQRGEEVNYQ